MNIRDLSIKSKLRELGSPRHVPHAIHAVTAIPYTISGKKVELAVKQTLMQQPVINRDALANPAALDEYAAINISI